MWVLFTELHIICMKNSSMFSPCSAFSPFNQKTLLMWGDPVAGSKVSLCNQSICSDAVIRLCSAHHNPSEEAPFPWILKQFLVLHPLGFSKSVRIQSRSQMDSNGLFFGKALWKHFKGQHFYNNYFSPSSWQKKRIKLLILHKEPWGRSRDRGL